MRVYTCVYVRPWTHVCTDRHTRVHTPRDAVPLKIIIPLQTGQ